MKSVALETVLATMEQINRGEAEHIDGNAVRAWMDASDIRVLGALYYILFDKRYYPKIAPPLDVVDYKNFLLPYYERCFREDPEVDWASTRYTAGWDFVGWFMGLWRDRSVPPSLIEDVKKWLAHLYLTSDDAVREALETATLEHLFEDKKVAAFFADWAQDPELRSAFARGMQWSVARKPTAPSDD